MTRGPDRTSERGSRRHRDGNPLLFCDIPIDQPGLIVHDKLVLKGWAASAGEIVGVTVQIDDEHQFQASYGLSSPWIAETIPDVPGAEAAGYELRLDTSEWTPGMRRVTIAATDRKGRRSEISGQVEVVPFTQPRYTVEENLTAIANGEPVMWLEEPRLVDRVPELAGKLEVAGWAYSTEGIDSVIVTVDQRARYEALRPISRGDLLAEYGADVAGEAGFFLTLDSLELPPGTHTVTVVALARDGQAVGIEGEIDFGAEQNSSPPSPGPGTVGWLDERKTRRLRQLDEESRTGVANRHADRLLEAERELRYRWAAKFVRGKEVLDVGDSPDRGAELLAGAGPGRLERGRGNLHGLRFSRESFDLVVCFDLIHRLSDSDALIEEMRRVLRPEGVLLISIPRRRVELRDDQSRRELTPGELERSLRDRFQNVAIHRQQTWLSSTLLDEGDTGEAAGDVDLEIDVRRIAANRPGEEAHVIGVAGDGPLPRAPRTGVLASVQPVREALATALMWEDRAHLAEADAAASRAQANLAQMHQKGTLGKLREAEARALRAAGLEASLSWRMTRPLRSLKSRLSSSGAAE